MASDNGNTITGDEMDVLDRLWDIFESVEIKWVTLSIHGGFIDSEHAKNYYEDIGKGKPGKFNITRRDLQTVAGLSDILGNVKVGIQIDWKRVAIRAGFRDKVTAKAYHPDMVKLEDRPRRFSRRLRDGRRSRILDSPEPLKD
ncbi:hypothetical protein PG990_002719 [Apiospora arundinis]